MECHSHTASFKIFINYCGDSGNLCFFSNKLHLKHLYFSFFFSPLQGSFFIFMEKKVLYIQSSACLCTAKSHGDWMSTAQFTAFLSISRQVKEQDNFAYLPLAAQLQQLVVRQHHLSSCADIFQLHILKLKI